MSRIIDNICRTLIYLLIPAVALVIWHGTKTAIEIKAVIAQCGLLAVLGLSAVKLLYKEEIKIPKDPLLGLIAAYGAVVIGAYVATQRTSLNTNAIIPQVYGIATFFTAVFYFDRRHIYLLVSLCAGVGTVTAIYGIIQYIQSDPLDWMIRAEDHRALMVSFFGQKNFLATFMLLMIPLGASAAILAKRIPIRAVFIFATVVMIIALMLSYSRGGVIAFYIVVFGYVGFYLPIKNRARLNLLKIGSVLLILAIALAGLLFILPQSIKKDFMLLDKGVSERVEFYRAGWETIGRHPMTGIGPGNFITAHRQNKTHKWGTTNPNQVLTHVHNELMETWLEYGLWGVLALTAIWGLLLFRLIRSLLQTENFNDRMIILCLLISISGYMLYGQFTVATRYMSSTFFFWLIAGLGYRMVGNGLNAHSYITMSNLIGMRLWVVVPAAVIIPVIFGVGIKKVVSNYQSEILLARASDSLSKRRYNHALIQLNRSIALRPNSVEAYYIRGYLFYQTNRMNSAISDYNTVHRMAPGYVNLDYNLACSYFKKKDWYNTIRAAERSHRLLPDYAAPLMILANSYYAIGDPERALSYCNLRLNLNPAHPQALKLKAHLLRVLKRK